MNSYLLIDCSNFNENRSREEITETLSTWIEKTHKPSTVIGNLIIRLYGGWHSDGVTTRDRYEANDRFIYKYPSIIKTSNHTMRVRIQFADYVFGEENKIGIKENVKNRIILGKC